MWIPDGVYEGFLRGIRGRVAVIVREKIPEMSFFRIEIQLEVDDGRMVGRSAGVIVVEHLEIIKWTRGEKPRADRVA